MSRWAAWLILFALNLANSAEAQTSKVALVIGNSSYVNTPVLDNARNDAKAISEALSRLGFEVVYGIDLNKRAMEQTGKEFAKKLSGADVGFLFYAGHGLQIGGQNYLVPVDAKLDEEGDVEFETIPISLLLRQMERQAKTNIILLDACRDNPLARNLARSMGTRGVQVGQGLAEIKAGIGTLIGFSTQPGNVAQDGSGQHSPYTKALLDNIELPEKDLISVLVSVRAQVVEVTQGRQVPWEHTSLMRQVFLKTLTDAEKQKTITYVDFVRRFRTADPVLKGSLFSEDEASVGSGRCSLASIFGNSQWRGNDAWGTIKFDADGRRGTYDGGKGHNGRMLLQGMVALGTISGFRFVLGEWYQSDDKSGVIQIAIGPQCAPVRVNWGVGLQIEDAWVRKK